MPAILIISNYFPPAFNVGAKRALRMAAHLSALGWRIQVLTLRDGYYEHHDRTLLPPRPEFEMVRTHAIVPKHWGRRLRRAFRKGSSDPGPDAAGASISAGSRPGSLLRGVSEAWDGVLSLPDEWVGWLPVAVAAGLRRARQPDLVLATIPSNTNAVIGALMSLARRVPLVLDYRDPWTTIEPSRGRHRWRISLDRALERLCLRRASLVVATTGGICDSLRVLRPPRSVVVTNASDRDAMSGIDATRYARFTIVYAGHFYGSRTGEPILKALGLLRSSSCLPAGGVALRVIGQSGPEVVALAKRLGVGDLVESEGPLPYRDALSRMKGADVLLVVVGPQDGIQVPAKLYDYLSARRFILGIAPEGSEAGRIIHELGVGSVARAEDIETIAGILAERFCAASGAVHPGASAYRYEARATMEPTFRTERPPVRGISFPGNSLSLRELRYS